MEQNFFLKDPTIIFEKKFEKTLLKVMKGHLVSWRWRGWSHFIQRMWLDFCNQDYLRNLVVFIPIIKTALVQIWFVVSSMSRDESVEPPVPRRDLGSKIAVRQFRDQHIFMNLSSVKMVEYVYHIESFGWSFLVYFLLNKSVFVTGD